MTETVAIIDATLSLSPYALADRVDVGSPDTKESPGVRFLERIQDYANEADPDALLESIRAFVASGNDAEEFTVNDLSDDIRDSMSEWADSCVQIYTYQLWQEFTDLCLWQEDPRDFLTDDLGDDLNKVASMAQYMVAERGLGVLLAERAVALYEANPVVSCDACGNTLVKDDQGRWVDPNETDNDGDLCLLNETDPGLYGPHQVSA